MKPIDRYRYDIVPAKLSAKPRVEAIIKFLYSGDQPDVLLLGSSLILVASTAADATIDQATPAALSNGLFEKLGKTDAIYASRCFSEKMEKPVRIRDLGIPAAMASDYGVLVNKLVVFGKTPRLLVIAIAPRDFCDNLYKDPQDTTSYQMLVKCFPTGSWSFPRKFASYLLSNDFGASEAAEYALDAAKIRVFTIRFHCDRFLRNSVLTLLNRSTAVSVAAAPQPIDAVSQEQHEQKVNPQPKKNYIDLDAYAFTYNPPDFKEFDQNFASLEGTLKVCRARGIPVALLDMPISQENKALIAPELYERYKSSLTRVHRETGIVVIQPESYVSFGSDDFEDSAHLRCPGAQKLFHAIGTVLAKLIQTPPAPNSSCKKLGAENTFE